VGVRVEEEDMCTGVRHHCCSAYLTFVSVLARGGAGRPPRALPRLAPTNRLHSAIYEAAEQCGPPQPSETQQGCAMIACSTQVLRARPYAALAQRASALIK
jgi:acyl-CoA hydrolase